NLESAAKKKAKQSGLEPSVVERELKASREGEEKVVETEDSPGAPFFRVVQEGGTRVLYLNIAHPFYTDLYQGPGSNPRLRAGLEVLLWVLGDAEVDADVHSDRRMFYETERGFVWSPTLAAALKSLSNIDLGVVESDEDAA
ncbi:MAG: Histidine kinase, gyrase and HSP90-like ATPase, partial [Frankiales bacterium]|nr:Histidine kinase, gyrase and HSP90-like ATPase [Frankiales bacterium]